MVGRSDIRFRPQLCVILFHAFLCCRSSICLTVSVSVASEERNCAIPRIVVMRYVSRKSSCGSSRWNCRGGESSILIRPRSSGNLAIRNWAISNSGGMMPADTTRRVFEARSTKSARTVASATSCLKSQPNSDHKPLARLTRTSEKWLMPYGGVALWSRGSFEQMFHIRRLVSIRSEEFSSGCTAGP
jgi:hypothetical protein